MVTNDELSPSEKQVLTKIRRQVPANYTRYDFWFVYDDGGTAISWEGGFDLPIDNYFRNQYSIQKGKKIVQNYD